MDGTLTSMGLTNVPAATDSKTVDNRLRNLDQQLLPGSQLYMVVAVILSIKLGCLLSI